MNEPAYQPGSLLRPSESATLAGLQVQLSLGDSNSEFIATGETEPGLSQMLAADFLPRTG